MKVRILLCQDRVEDREAVASVEVREAAASVEDHEAVASVAAALAVDTDREAITDIITIIISTDLSLDSIDHTTATDTVEAALAL